jgi:murein DD-endopeptidase MepM/ murein hydrolase activator NlpD
MAVRVPEAQEGGVVIQAAPRVMQRETRDGGGQAIARSVQRFGATMGGVAEAWDERLAKIDEAAVMEMDTQFGDWERDRLRGENGFLRQQGRNAMTGLDSTVEEFDTRQKEQLEAVDGERQRAMLERVQAQRRERFLDQVQGHVAVQTEKYWDDSFQARVGSMSNDIAAMPTDPERLPQMMALRDMYREYGERKGWDADMIQVATRDAFTNVHKASVAGILEAGDPTVARDYLDQWAPQIEATALTQLRGVVREQVDLFEADGFANGPVGAGPSMPVVPGPAPAEGGEARPFTLRAPVSATISSDFGPRRRPTAGASDNHPAVDYAVPAWTPVAAAGPGRVTFAGQQRGYGNVVIVDHGGGYETRYAHLGRIDVKEGDPVDAGRTVALSGGARGMAGAGTSTGAHLHFEVRRNGQAVDPEGAVGAVAVRGAGGAREAVPQPRTLEDAYDAADQAAGPNADWRRRETFRRAFAARYQRDQSFEADRERHAADAVAPYLPYGAQAAGSYTDIPLSVRQGLSPQQDTQIRGVFAREAEERANRGSATDDTVLNALLDVRVYQPEQFNRLDLTQYADKLSNSTLNSMLQAQRESRVRVTPENQTVRGVAQSALANTDGMTTRLLKSAGLEGDEMARAELRQYVATATEEIVRRTGAAPDERTVTGLFMQGMRVYEQTGDNGRRERVRAFQRDPGAEANIIIPRRDRGDIVARLRRPPYNLQNPTSQQVQDFYRRGVQEGLYRPQGTD